MLQLCPAMSSTYIGENCEIVAHKPFIIANGISQGILQCSCRGFAFYDRFTGSNVNASCVMGDIITTGALRGRWSYRTCSPVVLRPAASLVN